MTPETQTPEAATAAPAVVAAATVGAVAAGGSVPEAVAAVDTAEQTIAEAKVTINGVEDVLLHLVNFALSLPAHERFGHDDTLTAAAEWLADHRPS